MTATDTIAGYSAALKSSVGTPNGTVVFVVEKPEGGTIRIEESADETGIARTDFLGFHTKRAGHYSVFAVEKGDSEVNAPKASFEVFPDAVSTGASQVDVLRDAAPADGKDAAKIRVTLRDRYGNAVPKHSVDLISSRADDRVTAIGDNVSNEFGEVIFHIVSREVGVAHFSAFDRNAGFTLDERAKIIFFEAETKKSLGGSFYSADIFGESGDTENDFGPIDHFQVDFPAKVEVGSDSNFLKITALDKEGNIAKDYTGRIIISTPDDENAVLPGGGEYQFGDRDQGVRKFDLALIFSKTGRQKILVNDFEDGRVSPFLKGEKTVEVVDECLGDHCEGSGNTPPISTGGIVMKTPADGAKFGSARISLTGKARPNTNLKVFLDDREYDELEVDSDGLFVSELPNISDGKHEIFLREVSATEEKSSVVHFLVDTVPPTLDQVGVYPTGDIEAGSTVSVTIFSEEGLDAASLRVSGTVQSFQEDISQPGKYEANFSAPQSGGQYGISVSLTDTLKNTASFANAAKINVVSAGPILPAPKNIKAKAGDASALISWDAVAVDGISGYRIFSGANELFLKRTAEVSSDKSSVNLGDLTNDQRIFISVAAISPEGREGLHSGAVSVTPKGNLRPAPSPEEVLKRVSATPLDGKILLSWEDPVSAANFIDIRFGISSGSYSERFLISGEKNEAIVPDLINGLPYFFTIVPLDTNGIPTGEEYAEIRAVPNFSGIHPAPLHETVKNFNHILKTDDTGASANFIFGIALLFSAMMMRIRRRRP